MREPDERHCNRGRFIGRAATLPEDYKPEVKKPVRKIAFLQIAFENSLGFQAQIDNFHLKWEILGENP